MSFPHAIRLSSVQSHSADEHHLHGCGRLFLMTSLSVLLATLGACGGGEGGGGGGNPPAILPVAATVTELEVAQTHVIPPKGLQWSGYSNSGHLRPVEARDLLVLWHAPSNFTGAPKLEVWGNKTLRGTLALNEPSKLPISEGGDSSYASDAWSATIPASWVSIGLELRITERNKVVKDFSFVELAPQVDVSFYTLPVLLFGAPKETQGVMKMNASEKAQLAAGMPFSQTEVLEHRLGALALSELVLAPQGFPAPRTDKVPAKKVSSTADVGEQDLIWNVLRIAEDIAAASGDSILNRVTYAGISARDPKGDPSWMGGGLSGIGSAVAAGDAGFGLLWHENGHAMGVDHSPEEWRNGYFPYPAGSLKGSAWGYDHSKKYFRSPLTAPNSSYKTCADNPERGGLAFQKDSSGKRCYRFDPMHSGDDQGDPGAAFMLYSDFNTGRFLKWGLSRARFAKSGSGFEKLVDRKTWAAYSPQTEWSARFGFFSGFPKVLNKDLDLVYLTHSFTNPAQGTHIYPPIRHVGNSVQSVDPTDAAELKSISPMRELDGSYPSAYQYCIGDGCDFTIRATYDDGKQVYRLLKGSSRKNWQPEVWKDDYLDSLSDSSFLHWAIHVPVPEGKPRLKKVELLETPAAWKLSADVFQKAKVLSSMNL